MTRWDEAIKVLGFPSTFVPPSEANYVLSSSVCGTRLCVTLTTTTGHVYRKNSIYKNSLYLKCQARQCPCRAIIKFARPQDLLPSNDLPHNHDPDVKEARRVLLRKALMVFAREQCGGLYSTFLSFAGNLSAEDQLLVDFRSLSEYLFWKWQS